MVLRKAFPDARKSRIAAKVQCCDDRVRVSNGLRHEFRMLRPNEGMEPSTVP